MKAFQIVIYVIAVIPLITGVSDIFNGAAGLLAAKGQLTANAVKDPYLDNMYRFFAAIWLGVGVFMMLFVRDLTRYHTAMTALFGVIFVGGLARVISVVQLGMPVDQSQANIIIVGLVIELFVIPVLYLWMRYLRPAW